MPGPSGGRPLGPLMATDAGDTPAVTQRDGDERAVLLAAAYGARPHCLLLIDRDGLAQSLVGALPRGRPLVRVLEALEDRKVWEQVRTEHTYAVAELGKRVSGWPREALPEAYVRFFRDQEVPRGALFLQDRPAPSLSAVADRTTTLLLREALLSQEALGLRRCLHALVSATGQGVLALDEEGRVAFINPEGERLLGFAPGEAQGLDCTRVMRPAVGEKHPLLEGLAGRLQGVHLYVTDQNGRDLPLALQMRRMEDAAGQLWGLAALFRDLSDEQAFDQHAQQRERLAVIGELAAGVAHEIRNPLTGIANCAQVLQLRLAEEERNRKMADLILQETQRLERIVTSLLGFARPGPPRMQATEIDAIVARALELERAACDEAGVRVEHRVVGRIPTIYVDPEQVQQVLVNLVRNAVQAMEDGGVLTLEVSVVRRRLHRRRSIGRRATDRLRVTGEAPQVRFVRVRVQDTGRGIPSDVVGRIFDPFFTTRSRGTGLGLSVSQTIAREHGGYLSVQSVPGKGTLFDFDLPVERRHGERRDAPQS